MLQTTIENLSLLLGISSSIIMNAITLLVVIILVILSATSGLDMKTLSMVYGVAMAALTILGIDSVFNIFTLIRTAFYALLDIIF